MSNTFIFLIIGLGYVIGKVLLERRQAMVEEKQNRYELDNLAFAKGCSVYEIFKAAADKWSFSHYKVEQDFKNYLVGGFIPYYVHEYCRSDHLANDKTFQEILYSGGRPPYLS